MLVILKRSTAYKNKYERNKQMRAEINHWKDQRFGMFIHWGLYALLGRGEWVMFNEPIDKDEYRKLMDSFTAEKFDAREWARVAKKAGMRYMVMTTRHHDGFSLWDSKASYEQFTSMNSAAHRDFVREFADACRAEGLMVGFYYSPMDWRFPGFFMPRLYRKSALEMRKQCHEQIRELMTQYGKIDIMWFDGGEDFWLAHALDLHGGIKQRDITNPQCPDFWGAEELDRMIRELQPGIIINNRYGSREFGDFLTPEERTGEFNINEPWESNMTINGIWGWTPNPPRTLRECIRLLAKNVTGDGNFLLNVGPRADGTIEPVQVERLLEIGRWLEKYGESIYSTRGGPFKNSNTGGMTYRDRTLYVHIWDWEENVILLPKLDAKILSVTSLTADEFHWEMKDGCLSFYVGERDREAVNTVIKIELDRPVGELVSPETNWKQSPRCSYKNGALIVEGLLNK